MDANIFFLKKLSNEILESVLADEKNITWTHIDLARSNKWYLGVSIHQYLKILRCWKIIFKIYKGANFKELKNAVNNIEELNSYQKDIFIKIIEKWINDKVIIHALSDSIEKYKSKKIDFTQFVNSFIKRCNPFKSVG